MAYCPECGSEVGSGQSFCDECGHNLTDDTGTSGRGESGGTVTKQIQSSRELDRQSLLTHLQEMDDYDFEYFVADLWSELGWETEVSQASVDAGIDVIATKEHPYRQKKVIQAKRYAESTTVGGPDIQQYASLRRQVDNADSVVIVTTSSFTSSAESRAEDLNVKLVAGSDLVGIIKDLDAYHIADRYIDLLEKTTEEEETDTSAKQEAAVAEDFSLDSEPSTASVTEERVSKPDTGIASGWFAAVWISTSAHLISLVMTGSGSATLGPILFVLSWLATLGSVVMHTKRSNLNRQKLSTMALYAVILLPAISILAAGVHIIDTMKKAWMARSL